MNYIKTLMGALAALAASASLFAQTRAEDTSAAGLLGYRYAGAGFSVVDFRRDLSALSNGTGPTAFVNLPVAANIDLGLAYDYMRSSNANYKLREHSVGATVRAYNRYEGVKLFSDATLGYAWSRARVPAANFRLSDDDAFWSLGVGVEAPVANATALVGRVGYNDDFNRGSGSWTFTGGANHWFTSNVFGQATVTFVERDAIIYGISAGVRF
jgi:hypothetical protein